MRAAFVTNLYGSYGEAAVTSESFQKTIAKYGIQGLIFATADPNYRPITKMDVDYLRSHGHAIWAWRDPHWHGLGPIQLASAMLADLDRWAPRREPLALIADIEAHDPNYIIAWYLYLRARIEPWRRIGWTLEGHQGGWWTPDLIQIVNADPNLIIIPQQYQNGTNDWGPIDFVRQDIIGRGVNPVQVKVAVRGGELTPTNFPDGAAFAMAEGAPWGLT